METFCRIKKEINRLKEQAVLMQKRVEELDSDLFKNIIKTSLSSKFLCAKFKGYSREYLFCSSLILDEDWKINGIKITKDGEVKIGEISLYELREAESYSSIEPSVFFAKLVKLNKNLEGYDSSIAKECLIYKPSYCNSCDENKIMAAGYCRLSRGGSKNGYDRQITAIKKASEERGFYVREFFSETISGDVTFRKRESVGEMIEYCSNNKIGVIFVSELNRIGRTQKVIMDAITFLLKQGISEIHVLRENIIITENYILENFRTLKNMAKKCEEDRNNISYRLKSGYMAYMEKVKNGEAEKPGRKSTYKKPIEKYLEQYPKEINLLRQGFSMRKINAITGTALGTLQRIKNAEKNNIQYEKSEPLFH